ncbi:MAG: hypothetical protein MOB07_10280 [Acidobacteria bacterium]|nr:hypothetical protein [Acidobacteriota bacterium]
MPSPKMTRHKIVGFVYLPTGWNFGKGVPAKEQAVKGALTLLDDLEKAGFEKTDAYPGDGGSVMVSAYALPDYYDFDVKPCGEVTVAHGRGDEDVSYQEGMSIEEAQSKIKEFALRQWHTSDYSTSIIIIAENIDDLRATLSKAQETAQVSPSSITNAPSESAAEYVLIVPTSTQPSPERRSYSGRFHRKLLKATAI